MPIWWNGRHAALRTPYREMCRFKSCYRHQDIFMSSSRYIILAVLGITQNCLCPPLGQSDNGCPAACKAVANGIVGSSPTWPTKGLLFASFIRPMYEINGLETGFICASSSTDKSTRLRPVRLGVQIFSGVPSKRENLGY